MTNLRSPSCLGMPASGRVAARLFACVLAAASLGACSLADFTKPDPFKPAALQANPNLLSVRQAWTAKLAPVSFPLMLAVTPGSVIAAGSDGSLLSLDPANGAVQWRASVGAPLIAGVGSDGRTSAVITRENQLVAVSSSGQVLWRQPLGAQAYTAPLVAGGRVFVLAADRAVSAYDGATGRRLWIQQRPGEALVLRQAGVLLPVGNLLVAGQGGRLAGLDPNSGVIRWEATIGNTRGTNDVERLADLVGPASRLGDSVCARSFQTGVGCVDTSRGAVQWTRPAQGSEGVHGDDQFIFGAEDDGKVIAWRRTNGERVWTNDTLGYRGLGTPLVIGRSVAFGDRFGYIHLLSRADGKLLTRLSTDGSPLAAAPVLAGNTLVVATRNGGLFGFVPE